MSLERRRTFEGRTKSARSGRGGDDGRVGPNAAIQLLRVLSARTDPERRRMIVVLAGATQWASVEPTGMIDEGGAAALHATTRMVLGRERAIAVLTEAGALTGDYILLNRIPAFARAVLKATPSPLAARLLARAISAHAWTFVGSGRFVRPARNGRTLEIWSNPFCAGERSDEPLCVWHAAVIERLYRALVSSKLRVKETHCLARGDECCRFVVKGNGR